MRLRTICAAVTVGTFSAVVVGCAGGDSPEAAGPVDLRFALAVGAQVTYTAEYEQAVLVDMGDHAMEASRRHGARYAITGSVSADGGLQGSVRLDSLGIAITTAQGRQAFDTRHLIGDEFTITVGEEGGAPGYGGDLPTVDLGPMLGGEVGPVQFMGYGFPQLPDHAVSAGDTWQATSTRSQVEGILAVSGDLTTEYTFVGWEMVGGVECVKIEATIRGDLSGPGGHDETPFDYSGTLQGTATWFFDPASGSLVQMTGEESTDGLMTSEDISAPVQQQTTVRIRSAVVREE